MSKTEYKEKYEKSINLFRQEHHKFFEGTLLFNSWYCCLYRNPAWKCDEVSLDDKFPNDWMNLKIGNISFKYSLADIEEKYAKAPKLDEDSVLKIKDEMRSLGPFRSRGKYEMQFLFEYLSLIKNEPKKNRVYSVTSCHLPFCQNTMISTFSQYADVSERLYAYIETGKRVDN